MNIQVENVIAFLKTLGWKLDKITATDYLMAPPGYIKTDPKMRFHLAHEKFKGSPDYLENMFVITRSIAKLYDLDFAFLLELFSQPLPDMKAYQDVSARVFAQAA